jgi:LPXTG-motif cell wall-anchored protein
MKQRSRQGRRTAVGLGLIVAGAVTFVGALPGYASGAQETEATTSSSLVEDNPTCADLAPEGTTWTEFKVEPVADGTFTDGTLSVTIDVRDTDDGPVFDWTSNLGVDAVFVKGGPGGLLYVYDPESMGDTGLHAPVNPQNDMFFGLSHVSFCYDKDQATTTTTEKETTTTTAKDTTTTTAKETTTTTEQGVTTTTAGRGETTTTAAGGTTPTTQAVSGLPRTGSNSVPLLVLAAVLLGTGVALVAATRRFRNT